MIEKKLFLFIVLLINIYPYGNARTVDTLPDTLLIASEQSFKERKYKTVISRLLPIILQDSGLFSRQHTNRLLLLSEAYAHSGDKEKAYHYFKQYSNIKDSLSQKERDYNIARLETNYETEKKNKEIAEQQLLLKENERTAFRKNVIITGSIVVGILLLVLSWVSLNNFRKKREINERIREQMQHDQQIVQLKSYMEGTTEERQKITIQVKENIYPVIQEASAILDGITVKIKEWASSETLAETKLILKQVKQSLIAIGIPEAKNNPDKLYRSIENFLDNVPKEQSLSISFDFTGTEPPLTPLYLHNLLRIVQELVQNIIKHSGASTATINLSYTPEFIIIDVKDNGKGYTINTDNEGMGLTNIRQRVAELNGRIQIESVTGNHTEISVPIKPIYHLHKI